MLYLCMPRIPNTTCSVCKTEIYRRPNELQRTGGIAFCSQLCFGKHCRKDIPCVICGIPILSRLHRKTCSKECQEINNNRKDRNHSTGRKATVTDYRSRNFRRKFRKDRNNKCEACGYLGLYNLHIHHIVEKRNNGNNTEENLLLLCPNCHSEIHNNIKGLALSLIEKRRNLVV